MYQPRIYLCMSAAASVLMSVCGGSSSINNNKNNKYIYIYIFNNNFIKITISSYIELQNLKIRRFTTGVFNF